MQRVSQAHTCTIVCMQLRLMHAERTDQLPGWEGMAAASWAGKHWLHSYAICLHISGCFPMQVAVCIQLACLAACVQSTLGLYAQAVLSVWASHPKCSNPVPGMACRGSRLLDVLMKVRAEHISIIVLHVSCKHNKAVGARCWLAGNSVNRCVAWCWVES